MAKIVNIEWVQPTRKFQCPCCAAKALDSDGKVVSEPCRHFLFNWNGEREDFGDSTSEVESVLNNAALNVAGPLDQPLVESLSESSVLFEVVIRDEAHGPVVRTDIIAFDPMAA